MTGRIRWFIVCFAICASTLAQPGQRPNFIIILADDLGYNDLGIQGSNEIKTPNIDALARSGLMFSQGYVSSPVCSPSRAGLMTGINQVEFGYDNNLAENQKGFDPQFAGLPINQITIAETLEKQGYTTGLIGKWHLGDKDQFHPNNRGFKEFWGYLGGSHDYFETEVSNKGRYAPIICNYKQPAPLTYITDDKGNECVDFINRHLDQPFFLFASFNAPHSPMQAKPDDLELYEHIEDVNRRTYAAMVHSLDENVGKIIQTLDRLDLRENTLVVFLSDNGGPCDQNYSLNSPLRGQKGILLEGGVRVPFIFSWPGSLPQGQLYEHPVSSLDLAPTFEYLASRRVSSSYSGTNLIPYLETSHESMPHETLKWKFTISRAILENGYKLVSIPDRLPMLYHLPTDISEERNLALDSVELTKRLMKKLGQWDVSLPHPLFLEGAQWKEKQLELYDKDYQLRKHLEK